MQKSKKKNCLLTVLPHLLQFGRSAGVSLTFLLGFGLLTSWADKLIKLTISITYVATCIHSF